MPSLPRLYALRAMYLVLFALVPVMTAASMVYSSQHLTADDGWGFTACLLAALSLLSGLGLRYPLRMLPLLLFKAGWKLMWLIRVALPLWQGGHVDHALVGNVISTGTVFLVIVIVPWPYVITHYLRAPSEPWCRADWAVANGRANTLSSAT